LSRRFESAYLTRSFDIIQGRLPHAADDGCSPFRAVLRGNRCSSLSRDRRISSRDVFIQRFSAGNHCLVNNG
jgi:hypothetical protein